MTARFVPALRFHFLTRFYDPLLDRLFRDTHRKLRLISLGPPAAGERVLDLGGGTATLGRLVLRQQPQCQVVIADIDLAMLVRARHKLAGENGRWLLIRASADALPFADDRFDRAYSSLVFHHLLPPVKTGALAELRRVLRSGAHFLLLDFDRPRDPLMWAVSLVARLLDGWQNTADNFRGHLPQMIASAGFTDVHERRRERTPFGLLAYHVATREAEAT
jgi:ubiquinone/menaquinone biosynthesis C-methylase UbiE